MKRREQQIAFGALIVGLILGLIIGTALGEDVPLFGTLADEGEKTSDAASSEIELEYYLADMEAVETWLTEWLATAAPEDSDALTMLTESIQVVDAIAVFDDTPRTAKITAAEGDIDVLLSWSHTALSGGDSIDPEAEIKLPEKSDIVACIAEDSDPTSLKDPEDLSAIVLYVTVPPELNKDVPKDWESIQPKNPFDIGWELIKCAPLEADAG